MASNFQFPGPGTGLTCYIVIRNATAQPWSTSGGTGGFDTFLSGAWPQYAISATEQGVDNYYAANPPAALPAGIYEIEAKQQLGATPAQTDPRVAVGSENWNGTTLLPLSDLVTSGQFSQIAPIRLARGAMVQNFPLYLKSAADHITPFTSGVVSGQIARDGGLFGALQSGVFTERGLGFYSVTLTSGDLAGDTIRMLFTATGISGGVSDPLPIGVVTQRVSGY